MFISKHHSFKKDGTIINLVLRKILYVRFIQDNTIIQNARVL